jgi:hypothetical protein
MMEESTIAPAPSSRGIFGTKIPSSILFGIAILLFFLPFVDIKCNTMHLQTVSGFELATGFDIKEQEENNSLFNTEVDINNNKRENPNAFALAALVLGVAGFALAFANNKTGGTGGVITGTLAAIALTGLYIDIKNDTRIQNTNSSGEEATGFEKFGQRLAEGMKISVDFTPWFYIAVVILLAAAFMSYKRMQTVKQNGTVV